MHTKWWSLHIIVIKYMLYVVGTKYNKEKLILLFVFHYVFYHIIETNTDNMTIKNFYFTTKKNTH